VGGKRREEEGRQHQASDEPPPPSSSEFTSRSRFCRRKSAIASWRSRSPSSVMTKSRAPAGENNYPENCLVKPPERETRARSLAGMFGRKAPLRLAAQKNRLHAPLAPMRFTPAYFLCKWGV
jgi:hypothetical protein